MDLENLGNGQLIRAYLKARNERDRIKREMQKQMSPYQQAMDRIESILLKRMQESDEQNISASGGGTAYISTTYTAPIRDKQAFLEFLIERGAWELLDLKANAPAVRGFIEEFGEHPNGVEIVPRTKVNIRK